MNIRFHAAEKLNLQRAADQLGVPCGTFVRVAALRTAERVRTGAPPGLQARLLAVRERLTGRRASRLSRDETLEIRLILLEALDEVGAELHDEREAVAVQRGLANAFSRGLRRALTEREGEIEEE